MFAPAVCHRLFAWVSTRSIVLSTEPAFVCVGHFIMLRTISRKSSGCSTLLQFVDNSAASLQYISCSTIKCWESPRSTHNCYNFSKGFPLTFCGNGVNPDQISASWLRWKSALQIFRWSRFNEKKLLCFQSTMFTEYPPATELCKDRDRSTND